MNKYISKHFQITPEDFYHRYWELNESMEHIANEFGSKGCKLKYHIVKSGMPIKSHEQSYIDRMNSNATRKYFYNHNFFDVWSKEMAWILGLVITDGNIDQDWHRLVFASKDIELIHKFADCFGYKGSIEYNNSQCPLVRLSSKRIANSLSKLGVTPAKSLTIQFPEVPEEYLNDFLRGIFDGDGTINIMKSKKKETFPQIRVTIVTASNLFAKGLSDILSAHNLEHAVYEIHPKDKRNPRWNINFGAYNAIAFCKFIYQNASTNLLLERKKNIFDIFMQEHGHHYQNGHLVIRNNSKHFSLSQ